MQTTISNNHNSGYQANQSRSEKSKSFKTDRNNTGFDCSGFDICFRWETVEYSGLKRTNH